MQYVTGHSISPSNATAETKTRATQVSRFSNNQEFIAEALALQTYYHNQPSNSAPAAVPPHVKCCAFDMDGTLCNAKNMVTPATEAAVRAFAAGGGTVNTRNLLLSSLT